MAMLTVATVQVSSACAVMKVCRNQSVFHFPMPLWRFLGCTSPKGVIFPSSVCVCGVCVVNQSEAGGMYVYLCTRPMKGLGSTKGK